MGKRQLPPHMYRRAYKTRGGFSRTLYYARFTLLNETRTKPIPLGDNFENAKVLRDQYAIQVANGEDPTIAKTLRRPTFFPWAEYWLELKATQASLEKYTAAVLRLKEFFADFPLKSYQPSRAEAYKVWRTQQMTQHNRPPKPGTINRELSVFRSILTLAYADHAMPGKPTVSLLQEDNERDRTASEEEYAAILSTLKEPYRSVVVLLWEQGMRESEAVHLNRKQTNFLDESIIYTQTKRKKTRRTPMTPVTVATLRAIPQENTEEDRYFPGMTRYQLYWHFKMACDALGVPDLWVHDIRRTFMTRKELEGWPPKLIMMMTGLSQLRTYDRYNKPGFADLQKLVRRGASTKAAPVVAAPELPEQPPALDATVEMP